MIGRGQNFNGIDDYISFPDDTSFLIKEITCSFWFYIRESGREQIIIDWAEKWGTNPEFNDGWAVFLHTMVDCISADPERRVQQTALTVTFHQQRLSQINGTITPVL